MRARALRLVALLLLAASCGGDDEAETAGAHDAAG
jgi:hypothetical protein